MNWFKKLFKSKSLDRSKRDFVEGYDAFVIGEKIWNDIIALKGSPESKENKIKEALKYFDKAIEKGFDDSEVFSLRGGCLNDLGYYFEALKDYNKAIENHPTKIIAAYNYYMRSSIKDSLFDFAGSLADIKEAIRLLKSDKDAITYWDNYKKTTGFVSVYDWCEFRLEVAERNVERERTNSRMPYHKDAALAKIKRREQ